MGGIGTSGGGGAVVIYAYNVVSAPVVQGPTSRTSFLGRPVSIQVNALNSPTSYSATSLPTGLQISTSTGLITGTPTSLGTFNSQVSATNSFGTGQLAVSWGVQNDTQAPTTPTGLAGTMITSSSFRLTWTPSTDNDGVTAYEVRRNGVVFASPSTSSQEITGNTSGVSYTMDVRARDGTGNWSSWSSSIGVTQTTVGPPTAPTPLNYADRGATSITLLWGASTGSLPVVQYKIFRGGTEIASVNGLVFTDTGLPVNTSQTYTVKAMDSAGVLSTSSSSLVVSTTQDTNLDSDSDGVPNAMEAVLGTNPNSAGVNDSANSTQLKINHPPK